MRRFSRFGRRGVWIWAAAVLAAGAFPRGAAGDLIAFTNAQAFAAATTVDTRWGFDTLPAATQISQALAPDGSTVLTLAQSDPQPFGASSALLQGTAIFFNPEASRAFNFGTPVSAFGIDLVWNVAADPNGVAVQAFDASGHLIGTAAILPAQASNTFSFDGLNCAGFLGFQSSVPIASLSFEQSPGAVWYDNAEWQHALSVPEPAALVLLATGLVFGGLGRRLVWGDALSRR